MYTGLVYTHIFLGSVSRESLKEMPPHSTGHTWHPDFGFYYHSPKRKNQGSMKKCMIRGQETYKMSQSGSMEVLKKNRDKIITTKTYTDGGISRGQGAN